MIPLSYTLSFEIKQLLTHIDATRRAILIIPVSPILELKLRFDAKVQHIWNSLDLAGVPVPKIKVSDTLGNPRKKPTDTERAIISYRNALDYVHDTWLASPKLVTHTTIQIVASTLANNKISSLAFGETQSRQILQYLQNQSVHPVLQAAMATAWLTHTDPLPGDSGKTGRVLGLVMLGKSGYDIRQWVTIESIWAKNPSPYTHALQSITTTESLTKWIEYYCQTLLETYQNIYELVVSKSSSLPDPAFTLSDRQREIIGRMVSPTSTITNKAVQKIFGISQITASRELTRLTAMGLLYSHGRGRSVFYTRV